MGRQKRRAWPRHTDGTQKTMRELTPHEQDIHLGHILQDLKRELGLKKDPFAVALGRKGGRATSAAKAASSRENGKKGGRPKKAA